MLAIFEKIDPVAALKTGLPGIIFLMFLLSFWLLNNAQKQAKPRTNILKMIKLFMILSLVTALLFPVLDALGNKSQIESLQNQLASSTNKVAELQQSLQDCGKPSTNWISGTAPFTQVMLVSPRENRILIENAEKSGGNVLLVFKEGTQAGDPLKPGEFKEYSGFNISVRTHDYNHSLIANYRWQFVR